MTTIADFTRFSFGGVIIPYQSVNVKGGMRFHMHEYPHSPGAAPEKLGRKPYHVVLKATAMSESLDKDALEWPAGWAKLRKRWESGDTAEIHLPSIGKIMGFASEWDQTLESKVTSGEPFTIEFEEDQSDEFLKATARTTGSATISGRAKELQIQAATLRPRHSIFDAINNAANSLLAVVDTIDLYSGLVESKILGLSQLLEQADTRVKELTHPENHRVLDALHALWESVVDLKQDVDRLAFKLTAWETPTEMPIVAVAIRLYNDASRAEDLLHLNGFEDPYAIPAGTPVRYYKAS